MDLLINFSEVDLDTDSMALKLHNQKNFALEIERLVEEGDLTYLEAVTEFMKRTEIEPEKMKKLITHKIKDKMREEALSLNMFPDKKKDTPLEFED